MSTASITNPATTTTVTPTSARLGMMLTDLRLPTSKRLGGDLCVQSDTEGWLAHRLLEALLEHEINEREARRIGRHRNESGLSPSPSRARRRGARKVPMSGADAPTTTTAGGWGWRRRCAAPPSPGEATSGAVILCGRASPMPEHDTQAVTLKCQPSGLAWPQ